MTKSEYMKKLSYSLRRLPKEDFNQAIDYFEEYFAEAGEENEQQAIEDLGSPEETSLQTHRKQKQSRLRSHRSKKVRSEVRSAPRRFREYRMDWRH